MPQTLQDILQATLQPIMRTKEYHVTISNHRLSYDNDLIERLSEKDARDFALALVMFRKGYGLEGVVETFPQLQQTLIVYARDHKVRPNTRGHMPDQESLREMIDSINRRNNASDPLVMLGTTPSGPLHLANMYTMINGIAAIAKAAKTAQRKPRVIVGFNDYTITPEQIGHVPQRLHDLNEFMVNVSAFYGISIAIEPFSELQKTSAFRRMLTIAIMRGLIKNKNVSIYQRDDNGQKNPLQRLEKIGWFKRSKNYMVGDLLQTIGVRAAKHAPSIYILGGDHAHHFDPFIIGERMRVKRPVLIRMGSLYGLDGEEMHVSNNNFIGYDELKESIPDTKKLIEAVQSIGNAPQRAIGPLDYTHIIPSKHATMYGSVPIPRKA